MGFVLHQRTHPGLDVPGCFGCRVASVAVVIPPHMKAIANG